MPRRAVQTYREAPARKEKRLQDADETGENSRSSDDETDQCAHGQDDQPAHRNDPQPRRRPLAYERSEPIAKHCRKDDRESGRKRRELQLSPAARKISGGRDSDEERTPHWPHERGH